MENFAVRTENLSKRYRIGLKEEVHDTFSGALFSWFKSPIKNYKRLRSLSKFDENGEAPDILWALRDISFNVREGEAIGIIGRNGAGKSTLLKILSRITEPTTGKVEIQGRVSSLLEVGTGFHPELTGRENIYLNGTILGMSKKEIDRKFDEIVDFSGVEKFIDTPIKRYSTGMNVRLAFAVAAHLEPDILIIDEVLAVGDAEFQKKCLGKMDSVAKSGRTVLFVSHNLAAVQTLCTGAIVLEHGKIIYEGSSESAVRFYLDRTFKHNFEVDLIERKDRRGTGNVLFKSFRVLNSDGEEVKILKSGEDYIFEIGYKNLLKRELNNIVFSLDIHDERENRILLFRTSFTNQNLSIKSDEGHVYCRVDNLPLANGMYSVSLYISYYDAEVLDWLFDVAKIAVNGGDYFGTGSQGIPENCKVLKKSYWFTDAQFPPNNKKTISELKNILK